MPYLIARSLSYFAGAVIGYYWVRSLRKNRR